LSLSRSGLDQENFGLTDRRKVDPTDNDEAWLGWATRNRGFLPLIPEKAKTIRQIMQDHSVTVDRLWSP
jgi:hypothetical protein